MLDYARRAGPAGSVFELRQSTDRYHTWVLTDPATLQAFYDYEHAYVYDRLPAQIAAGDVQFYPGDHNILQELVDTRIDIIVVSVDSEGIFSDLLDDRGLTSVKLFDNGVYEAWRIVHE